MDKNKKRHPVGRYFLNIALAFDQLGNSILLGDCDETISSRLGKLERNHGGKIRWTRPFARITAWWLDKIDKDHCQEAIEEDEGKDGLFI